MFALRQVPSETGDGLPASASSTRASSHATQEAPPSAQDAELCRPGKAPKAGDVVDGRYVLIEQLGKGGMGVVWKARSTALDVEVAVKLVRGTTPNTESFKRMAREAHAAARLGHPAMATVLDFGSTQNGEPYVAMELLRGESLGQVLGRERRVDVLRAVGTLLPIMDGLREAHDKGIVHRDLKPENLFISKTARGRLQPKVLDFGIAKLDVPGDSNTRLTQDGAVLGSPGYFSPEQARGQTDIDFRTDIWSISVVLYELITGELPFSGPNYNALLMSILKDTPPSIMSHGYGDEELWKILQRGLHRDRSKRWGSMWELGRALAGWLYDKGVRADVASRSIKEVWLDAGSESEQAPPPEGFGAENTRRKVLSTLIKRRSADTLEGGTMSNNAVRRVPTRLLGWGAAALSMGAILWSVLVQGGTGTVAHAAATPGAKAQLTAPLPVSPPASVRPIQAPQPAEPVALKSALPKPSLAAPAKAPVKPARTAAPTAEDRAPVSASAQSKRAQAQLAKSVEPAASKTPRAAQPPVAARAKPSKSLVQKRIDQEFGF